MANYNQAPSLYSDGNKRLVVTGYKLTGYSQRNHCLESALACCLGDRDFAMYKIMIFLTGMSDDGTFKVSEKTVCQHCNISEGGYKKAREKLSKKGWISHSKSESITIHYNKIFSDYQEYLKRYTEDTPNPELESTGDTPSIDTKNTGDTPKGYTGFPPGYTGDTSQGYTGDTHNNTNNNKNNRTKIKKEILAAKINPDDILGGME